MKLRAAAVVTLALAFVSSLASARDRKVRRGDLLFFAFRPGLLASHFAIVRARPRGGSAPTVEGNVSNAVQVERRGLQYTVLAARVTG